MVHLGEGVFIDDVLDLVGGQHVLDCLGVRW